MGIARASLSGESLGGWVASHIVDLSAFLMAEAPRSEAAGRLTEVTVAALQDAGLFAMFLPRCFGGSECWPTEGLEIVEALAYGDGSTGWVQMTTQISIATAAA